MLLATWDGSSCVTVGSLVCGGEKTSLVLGFEGGGSGVGTLAMFTSGCLNSSLIDGQVLLDFLGQLPILFGLLVDEALDMLPGCMFEVISLAADGFTVLYSRWSD